ncbi:MAG: hypothetical protein HY720_05230 [Planctomycetes bacterium]|nr:hypothetical protein [Planctomycetota bacterium]
MPARRFYVDTSAYLCILLGETGHDPLARELAGSSILSSCLLVLEAHRTLVRLARDRFLSASDLQLALDRLDADLSVFLFHDLTLGLCRQRTMPVVTTPRSLDLAHLRTAVAIHARDPLTRFVSLDAVQNHAAREMGLPV